MTYHKIILHLVLLAFAITPLSHSHADITLPTVLSSHMVLQCDTTVPIWGNANPGEAITVTIADQSHQTTANTAGVWSVTLNPMPASFKPEVLTIKANNTLVLEDILVGEVWLCSGQSNMRWSLKGAHNADIEILSASNPSLRLFQVDCKTSLEPRSQVNGEWKSCNAATAKQFSAAGYFFGRDLQKVLNVPVGLIDSSWGGTTAEAWTRVEKLTNSLPMKPTLEQWETLIADYPEVLKVWQLDLATWKAEHKSEMPAPNSPNNSAARKVRPRKPRGPLNQNRPGILADSMIAPIVPFAIKGAIWYQGESNASRYEQYRTLLPIMIADWRERWNNENLFFGIVQLANFMPPKNAPSDDSWPRLRDAQLETHRNVPNTGLAVITDIGEANDIHPRNKLDVGRRLARWALADVYGLDIVGSSPIPRDHQIEESKIIITFKHVNKGLKILNGGDPAGFTIAGKDAIWHPATAKLTSKDTIELSSEDVPSPMAVRYAWQNNPVKANVINSSYMPLTPFRTDNWPKGYKPVSHNQKYK